MRELQQVTEAQVEEILGRVRFDEHELVPAIAKQWDTGEVLMLAWMNADSIRETLLTRRAVYWSRSRGVLWRKGDTSGHTQRVMGFAVDCDADTVLLEVDQVGAACHLDTRTCWDSDEFAIRFVDDVDIDEDAG